MAAGGDRHLAGKASSLCHVIASSKCTRINYTSAENSQVWECAKEAKALKREVWCKKKIDYQSEKRSSVKIDSRCLHTLTQNPLEIQSKVLHRKGRSLSPSMFLRDACRSLNQELVGFMQDQSKRLP